MDSTNRSFIRAGTRQTDWVIITEIKEEKLYLFSEIRNSERMTINYVREMLGDDYPISYFDCQTQKEFRTTLLRYYNYFEDKEVREDGTHARFLQNKLINKRFNVISIEFSDEKLADYVDIPMLYRRISWQSLVPKDPIKKYETPPKMGKYVLIGNFDYQRTKT